MNNIKAKNFTTERIVIIGIFAALTCVCAWIAVPSPFTPGVYFTLQTAALTLAGLLLTPLESALVSIVYLMLGIVGLPVCSGMTTFYSKIGTAGGGYLYGFLLAPFLISLVRTAVARFVKNKQYSDKKLKSINLISCILISIIIGIPVIDIPGVIQYKLINHYTWGLAIIQGALSFLATDILKCVLASLLAEILEKPLKRIRKQK